MVSHWHYKSLAMKEFMYIWCTFSGQQHPNTTLILLLSRYEPMLDWYRLFFLFTNIIWVFVMRISYCLTGKGKGIWWCFCLRYHLGLYTMQELSYLAEITLSSMWFRMIISQIITQAYKDSLIMTYASNIKFWLLISCIHIYTSRTLEWISLALSTRTKQLQLKVHVKSSLCCMPK
jgi:hypothetical protein